MLIAKPGTNKVVIAVRAGADDLDELLRIELQDTSLNGINLNLLVLNDPDSPRFATDYDEEGKPTQFGTVRRNLAAEEEAMRAWVFERRGFAYVRGHKLMDDIHREFQPEGRLYQALDGSTPFRQPDQWCAVRGRAWAIHDGILEVLGARWDDLRMVKQVGRQAGVNTFSGAVY